VSNNRGQLKGDTPSNLKDLTARRLEMIASRATSLIEQYNSSATNQTHKPPLDGVLLSWRLSHETIENNPISRALALPITRVTYWRKTKRLKRKASLSVSSQPKTLIHDGQDRLDKSRPLPLSQSGQDN
jgi:hypothetical protein